jgi:hypothetical protein
MSQESYIYCLEARPRPDTHLGEGGIRWRLRYVSDGASAGYMEEELLTLGPKRELQVLYRPSSDRGEFGQ